MKIVDVCEFYSDFGGGVRTYVHQKLEAGARAGVDVTIIAPGPADMREARHGGEIIWVKSPIIPFDQRYHLFWKSEPVHQLLDEIQPDVIEGSSTWRGGWIAGGWQGKAAKSLFIHQDPVAVYPHTMFGPALREERIDKMFGWFWRYMDRLANTYDETVVSGDWLAARFENMGMRRPFAASFGVERDKFSHHFKNQSARTEMLRACGVEDEFAPLFIAVSRHHPEKRLNVMINAFEKFSKQRPAGLFLIGDGPARRWIDRRAAKVAGVHVAGHVGNRKELATKLASADYFIHGGAAETYGLVVAEALCSGLPIVTPDIGGAADIAHPTYAETYRAGDANAFSAALERITMRDQRDLSLAARAGANRIGSPGDHFDLLFGRYSQLADDVRHKKAA